LLLVHGFGASSCLAGTLGVASTGSQIHFLTLANAIQHSSHTCRGSTPSFASRSALSLPGTFECAGTQITRPSPWNLSAAQPVPDFVDGWLRRANSVRFGIDSLDYTDVVEVQKLMLPWGACSIAVLTASRAASAPRRRLPSTSHSFSDPQIALPPLAGVASVPKI